MNFIGKNKMLKEVQV